MKREKKLKQLFLLSFLPYVYLVVYPLYFAVAGYDLYTWILPRYVRTLYGWEAYREVFLWTGLKMCLIPVIPGCLLCQLLYLLHRRRTRKTGRDGNQEEVRDSRKKGTGESDDCT